jgi:hypothetical protein
MERIIPPGLWVFSVLAFLSSLNILATDVSVLNQCRQSCWLNSFLFGVLGEFGARVAFAIIWFAVAALIAFFAYRLQRKNK